MRKYLLSLLILVGCVDIQSRPIPRPDDKKEPVQPIIKNDVDKSLKIYASKAADVFAQAAVMLERDKNVQAVHDYLTANLKTSRAKAFEGIDNRLEEVLGVEKPDISKGVELLNKISSEFQEASK